MVPPSKHREQFEVEAPRYNSHPRDHASVGPTEVGWPALRRFDCIRWWCIPGTGWPATPAYGVPLPPMGFHSHLWGSTPTYGVPLPPMGFHSCLWGSTPTYGVPLPPMGFHSCLWGSTPTYGVPLLPMGFHYPAYGVPLPCLWGPTPTYGVPLPCLWGPTPTYLWGPTPTYMYLWGSTTLPMGFHYHTYWVFLLNRLLCIPQAALSHIFGQ